MLFKTVTPAMLRLPFPSDGVSIRPYPVMQLQLLGVGPNQLIDAFANVMLKHDGAAPGTPPPAWIGPDHAFTSSTLLISPTPLVGPLIGLPNNLRFSVANGENISRRDKDPGNVYRAHFKHGRTLVNYSDPWIAFVLWCTAVGTTDADSLDIPQAGYCDLQVRVD